jgi:hypothetical protein
MLFQSDCEEKSSLIFESWNGLRRVHKVIKPLHNFTKKFVSPFLVTVGFAVLGLASIKSVPVSDSVSTLVSKETNDNLSPEEIREGERLLVKLGYWIAPADDEQSSQPLIAFQKVERRKLTGKWTTSELAALRRAARPEPREFGFEHIEIDLSRQVLFVVGPKSIDLILPVATGTGKLFIEGGWTRRAITPTGRFEIFRKVEGWRDSSLGQLYYPNYFTRGIAIHGSRSVSTDPSSFGCIRIPMYAAVEFSKMTPLGTPVIVYGQIRGGGNHRSSSKQPQ